MIFPSVLRVSRRVPAAISAFSFAIFGLLLLLWAIPSQRALAQSVHSGKATYVTSSSVYVDLGSNQGFDVDDTLRVVSKGATAAVLIVTNISSRSMATRILSRNGSITEGAVVMGTPRRPPPETHPILRADTSARPAPDSAAVSRPARRDLPIAESTANTSAQTIRGRVSMQYYALHSRGSSVLDFSQPAISLQLNAERLFALPLQFTMYSNHRYDARSDAARRSSADARISNRIYQLAFEYGSADAPFSATLGRFIAPAVGGVGTFDGGMAVARSGAWEAGLAIGAQPGYRESEVNPEDPKAATYVTYTHGDWQSTRYQAGAAFAQSYKGGAVDRSLIYLQNMLSFASGVSVYQNANVDIYDISPDGATTSLHLSDAFISASWRALRWLSVNGSFATRRNVYYRRSFGFISDSLFDKRRQNDVQLSTGVNLPLAMFLSLTGSIRAREGDARPADALSARYSWSNVLNTEANLYLTASAADNIYSTSRTFGVEVNRELFSGLTASLRAQQFEYRIENPSRTLQRSALSFDVYARVGQMLFGTFGFEQAWEGRAAIGRFFGDISIRF